MLNSLSRFKEGDIYFSDITFDFLNKYEEFLKSNGTGARGLSLYTGIIRAVFNNAIAEYNDEENDIIKIKSPFKKYKIKIEPTPQTRSIELEQLLHLFSLPYTDLQRENLAKDIFILSFYLEIPIKKVPLFLCKLVPCG